MKHHIKDRGVRRRTKGKAEIEPRQDDQWSRAVTAGQDKNQQQQQQHRHQHLHALFVFALVVLFWGCIFDLLESNVTLQFISLWSRSVCGDMDCEYQPSIARMLTGLVFVLLSSSMLLAMGSSAFFNALGSDDAGELKPPGLSLTDNLLGIKLEVPVLHRRVYVGRLLYFLLYGFLCVLVWKGFEHVWDGLRDLLTISLAVSKQLVIAFLFLCSTTTLVMIGEMSNQFAATEAQRDKLVMVKDDKTRE
ncbi:hypothetical protein GUITHDRAFT_147000 [Guillardia theta CCMP2712]|uniref:Uncharacterized protein n=2 Tax=Guillardia theta TaxID=55529 RepID=L1IFQ9_GUITC|nr:hypothetical protein GUITHDRAFT_147000 [Guillardia theta CCMP2712]EKX34675.1 hypothetical protein GUITHDRAFT_147000 [Guillardia theta CCMP2712]|mmetsp:Transcript_12884/g.45292  ORF Transcript_12884/g.45292 Transcript_12884/m.45292 type:complete len:248 (+) Transcript_12884:67-810(+)|eukprot:XP_005821655.1 hypothetical protein GUITHDRAFT_147000 [Guillardia theta CCMP2712]